MQDGELSIPEIQDGNIEEYEQDDYLDESDKSWSNNKNQTFFATVLQNLLYNDKK